MNLPLFIAGRYLFARKSHNVINIISAISAIGMAIGTAALILILSVYNGFDKIIRDNLSDLDPDFRITPSTGKCFVPEGEAFDWLYDDGRVKSLCSVIEENVFIRYDEKQGIARAKGVDEVYMEESGLSGHVMAGDFKLRNGDIDMAAVGSTLASQMRINPRFVSPLELYFPDRDGRISLTNPAASLKISKVYPSCIIGISSDIDAELLVVPIGCMRSLLEYDDEVSAVEVRTAEIGKSGQKRFLRELEDRLGDGFTVSDRLGQHPALFKMMKYEKAAIFLILLFVVIIVAFNIFGSLSMLIMEKEDDAATLRAMGAGEGLIRRIFILSGWLVSLLGLAVGLLAGCGLAVLQQTTGLVKMPGNFLVESYPVVLQGTDIIITAVSVAVIGLVVACIPAINQKNKI